MAAIQILSDLHLESPQAYDLYPITPVAPTLALLGDIGNVAVHKSACLTFLTVQLTRFHTVLFVPGNHDAYHSSWPATLAILRAFEHATRADPALGTFVLLDRTVFRLPGTSVTLLGCSLFSAVAPGTQAATDVGLGLNDFYHTADWDVAMHHAAHERDLAWLNETVAQLEREMELAEAEAGDDGGAGAGGAGEIVVLTHWCPTRDARAIRARHADSAVRSAFATELERERCFRSGRVGVWAFGHTHFNCDFRVQRGAGRRPLRLVTNQRGYYFAQAEGFDAEMVVVVGGGMR